MPAASARSARSPVLDQLEDRATTLRLSAAEEAR